MAVGKFNGANTYGLFVQAQVRTDNSVPAHALCAQRRQLQRLQQEPDLQ